MSGPSTARDIEAFLARLLADPGLRQRFLEDPEREARSARLPEPVIAELASMDLAGLELAGESFDAKRRR